MHCDWERFWQIRDQSLSKLKSNIELLYLTNGNKKVVVVPHSMGVIYFLHFLKWVEMPPPMGGGGGQGWCDKHIKAIMNISPAFLGVPKAVSNMFSAEGKEVAYVRSALYSLFVRSLYFMLLHQLFLGSNIRSVWEETGISCIDSMMIGLQDVPRIYMHSKELKMRINKYPFWCKVKLQR